MPLCFWLAKRKYEHSKRAVYFCTPNVLYVFPAQICSDSIHNLLTRLFTWQAVLFTCQYMPPSKPETFCLPSHLFAESLATAIASSAATVAGSKMLSAGASLPKQGVARLMRRDACGIFLPYTVLCFVCLHRGAKSNLGRDSKKRCP